MTRADLLRALADGARVVDMNGRNAPAYSAKLIRDGHRDHLVTRAMLSLATREGLLKKKICASGREWVLTRAGEALVEAQP